MHRRLVLFVADKRGLDDWMEDDGWMTWVDKTKGGRDDVFGRSCEEGRFDFYGCYY